MLNSLVKGAISALKGNPLGDYESEILNELRTYSVNDLLCRAVMRKRKECASDMEFFLIDSILGGNKKIISYLESITGEDVSSYCTPSFEPWEIYQIQVLTSGHIGDKVGSLDTYCTPMSIEICKQFREGRLEYIIRDCYIDYENYQGSYGVLLDLEFKITTLAQKDLIYFFKTFWVKPDSPIRIIYKDIVYDSSEKLFRNLNRKINDIFKKSSDFHGEALPGYNLDNQKEEFLRVYKREELGDIDLVLYEIRDNFSTVSGWSSDVYVRTYVVVNEKGDNITFLKTRITLEDRPCRNEDIEDIHESVIFRLNREIHKKQIGMYTEERW